MQNYNLKFLLLQFPFRVAIDFLSDGMVSIEPGVAITYSKFVGGIFTKIYTLSSKSSNNHCGGPAVGIQLETTIFSKAWAAFKHWMSNGFAELSTAGLINSFQVPHIDINDLTMTTNPVTFDTKASNASENIPVFLKRGHVEVEKSRVEIHNLTLDHHAEFHFKTVARVEVKIPVGDIEAVAILNKNKKQLKVATSFRDGILELPFDINVSGWKGKFKTVSNASLSAHNYTLLRKPMAPRSNDSNGVFQMRNITVQSHDNSSVFTKALSGVIETIFVRSSRQVFSLETCQQMLYNIFHLDFVTSAMTVPEGDVLRVTFAGGDAKDSTPLTINLYQLGRVANNVDMIASAHCLDRTNGTSSATLSKRTADKLPRSEALLQTGTYNYNYTIDTSLFDDYDPEVFDGNATDHPNPIRIHFLSASIDGMDARVLPIDELIQIDRVSVVLNGTDQRQKANLDFQVSLKQPSSPFGSFL